MSNKKIRIGIDVDNVVLDFTGRFIECFYQETGFILDRNEIDDWNFKNYIDKKYQYDNNIKGDIVNEMLFSGKLITDMKYKLRSREAILKMAKHNDIEIVFITALADELAHIRKSWFDENFNDISYELHFESKKSKIKIDYLIDDGVHNLDELSKYIPFENCLCIKEPYNNNSNYLKFDDLSDAYQYIIEKEKLV